MKMYPLMQLRTASMRPTTQQGLPGPPSAAGITTANPQRRLYRDKRYYLGLIQQHMQKIQSETGQMASDMNESRIEQISNEKYKRMAEQSAKELAELEEELAQLNMALEIGNDRERRFELDRATDTLRVENKKLMAELEEGFGQKVALEEEMAKVKIDLAEEDVKISTYIQALPEEEQKQYYSTVEMNDQYKEQVDSFRVQIEECKDEMNELEESISRSDARKTKLGLKRKQRELQKQVDELEGELGHSARNPQEEKEFYLKQIKDSTADIKAFKAQAEGLTELLEDKRKELAELDAELSESNMTRINKYKELLKREETMDAFMNTFQENYEREKGEVSRLQDEIESSLKNLSYAVMDISDVDVNESIVEELAGKPEEEILAERDRLLKKLEMVHMIEQRYKNEIRSLEEDRAKVRKDVERSDNLDREKIALLERRASLAEQKEAAFNVLKTTKDAVAAAEKQRAQLDTELEKNEEYQEVKKMKQKLEDLGEEENQLKQYIQSVEESLNYERLKSDALRLAREHNERLKRKYKKRSKKPQEYYE